MKLVTSSQMQALDRAAIEQYKIPSLELMERAGRGVAELIKGRYSGPAAIVAGKGNNGGDGLVAARYLAASGVETTVFLLASPDQLSPDAKTNWEKIKDTTRHYLIDEISNLAGLLRSYAVIVDAIFGTGLVNDVKGKFRTVIEILNSLGRPVVSIDVPSGLNATTGRPLGVAVRANVTTTLGLPKLGLVIYPGYEYAREVKIIDIGLPDEMVRNTHTGYFLTSPDMFTKYLGERDKEAHKGTYGHALIIAGSLGKLGAGLITSRACLRAGAGLVTFALPETTFTKFDTKLPEIMYEPLPNAKRGHLTAASFAKIREIAQDKAVIAIGPGIGVAKETGELLLEVIKKINVPIIIDADGLNLMVGKLDALTRRRAPTVLTPHPGEMSRLTGLTAKEIQVSRVEIAKKFSISHQVYLVLKGFRTIVATPKGDVYINPTGNPGMATAGMGDALTGVLAGLLMQNIPVEDALALGVYIHGKAGDIAAEEIGSVGILASDLIERLPKARKEIQNFKIQTSNFQTSK